MNRRRITAIALAPAIPSCTLLLTTLLLLNTAIFCQSVPQIFLPSADRKQNDTINLYLSKFGYTKNLNDLADTTKISKNSALNLSGIALDDGRAHTNSNVFNVKTGSWTLKITKNCILPFGNSFSANILKSDCAFCVTWQTQGQEKFDKRTDKALKNLIESTLADINHAKRKNP